MLHDLKKDGYAVDAIPQSPRELLDLVEDGGLGTSLEEYLAPSNQIPADANAAIEAAWGDVSSLHSFTPPSGLSAISPREIRLSSAAPPISNDAGEGAASPRLISPLEGEMAGRPEGGNVEREFTTEPHRFPFRAVTFGNVTVALAPDRGRSEDRRADYHDPTLPPRHDLVAFGLWLRKTLGVHAIVHVGAHGTLEWLPGKTVAMSANCFPEIVDRSPASRLSLHRLEPWRGRAGQAPYRRRHARPPATAAGRCRTRRAETEARAAGRRICAGRRAGSPSARPAGEADRRDRRQDRAGLGSRRRRHRRSRTRHCGASMPGSATSRISPSRTGCTSTAALSRTASRSARKAPRPSARR